MKRSQINAAVADARLAFACHHWHLPPNPRWDVTGFGLGDFEHKGLVLVNLAELPQYCEKLMFAKAGQKTVMHYHRQKQEDIISRVGTFAICLAGRKSDGSVERDPAAKVRVLINGQEQQIAAGSVVYINQGKRITLFPGINHEFWPVSEYCIIGEVSTANDDVHDNYFEAPEVGRYEAIEEDEPALVRLLSDK
jgi:D-lyxose ketol-isomerase